MKYYILSFAPTASVLRHWEVEGYVLTPSLLNCLVGHKLRICLSWPSFLLMTTRASEKLAIVVRFVAILEPDYTLIGYNTAMVACPFSAVFFPPSCSGHSRAYCSFLLVHHTHDGICSALSRILSFSRLFEATKVSHSRRRVKLCCICANCAVPICK